MRRYILLAILVYFAITTALQVTTAREIEELHAEVARLRAETMALRDSAVTVERFRAWRDTFEEWNKFTLVPPSALVRNGDPK